MSDYSVNEDEELPAMGLLDHLEELRWTVTRCIIAIVICFPIGYFFVDDFIQYNLALSKVKRLMAIGVAEIYLQKFRIALMLSLFVSAPYILLQAWKFISPALYEKEKKWGGFGVWGSYFLFFCGCLFGLFLIVPMALDFMYSQQTESLWYQPQFKDIITFTFRVSVAMGIVSQLPVVVILLFSLGIIELATLKEYRSHIYVCLFVLAAVVTPPDVISQIMLAVPTIILYEASLLFCHFIGSDKKKISKLTLIKAGLGLAIFIGGGGFGIYRVYQLKYGEQTALVELDKTQAIELLKTPEGQSKLAVTINALHLKGLVLSRDAYQVLLNDWKEAKLNIELQKVLLNYAFNLSLEREGQDVHLHIQPRLEVPLSLEAMWQVQIDKNEAVLLTGSNKIYYYQAQKGIVPDALTRRNIFTQSAKLKSQWTEESQLTFSLKLLKVSDQTGKELVQFDQIKARPLVQVKKEVVDKK